MSPYREPARPEPVLAQEPAPSLWPLLVHIAALLLGIAGAYHECTKPPAPPPPCSDYARWPRYQVPARCFSDFLQDGGP